MPRKDVKNNFYFSNLAIPLRIGIMSVCLVFAFLSLAGTVRYAISLPSSNSQPSSKTPTNQTNKPNVNQPATPQPVPTAPTQPSTNTGGSTSNNCNSALKSTYTTQYNSRVSQENQRHANTIQFLTNTNASASAFAVEEATNSANLSSINSQYQANLRSIGC